MYYNFEYGEPLTHNCFNSDPAWFSWGAIRHLWWLPLPPSVLVYISCGTRKLFLGTSLRLSSHTIHRQASAALCL